MGVFTNNEMGIIERLNRRFGFNKYEKRQDRAGAAEVARQREALSQAAKLSYIVPAFIEAATSGIDGDLLKDKPQGTPTQEQIAGMTDEELEVALKLADDMRRAHVRVNDLRQCVANLESAKGWDVADDLAEEARVIIEASEQVAEVGRGYHERVSIEIQRRKSAAETEARKRRYIKEHKEEFIEALIIGDDDRVSEIREHLENPPAIPESEPAAVQVWSGFPSDAILGAGDDESADAPALNEAAEHFKHAYEHQQGGGADAGDVSHALQ